MVLTWRHTPRFCGEASRSLTLLIRGRARRGFLINWLIVGIVHVSYALRPPGVRSPRAKRAQRRDGWLGQMRITLRAGGNRRPRAESGGVYGSRIPLARAEAAPAHGAGAT